MTIKLTNEQINQIKEDGHLSIEHPNGDWKGLSIYIEYDDDLGLKYIEHRSSPCGDYEMYSIKKEELEWLRNKP